MKGADSVTHQLTKKLQHLKKKIKQFEEQFEKERNYKVKELPLMTVDECTHLWMIFMEAVISHPILWTVSPLVCAALSWRQGS